MPCAWTPPVPSPGGVSAPAARGVTVLATGGALGPGDAVRAPGVFEVTAACRLLARGPVGGSAVTGSASAAIAPATTITDAVTAAPIRPAISPGLIDSRSASWRGTEAIAAHIAAPRRSE